MEKEIVKSRSFKFKWIMAIFSTIAVINVLVFIIPSIPSFSESLSFYEKYIDFAEVASESGKTKDEYTGIEYDDNGKASKITLSNYDVITLCEAGNGFLYAMEESQLGEFAGIGLLLSLLWLLFGVLCWLLFRFTTITVTNKSIYYKFIFLQSTVLPVDAITSSSTFFLMGVSAGTSSKKVRICLIPNYKEVHTAIVNLVIERQTENNKNCKTMSEII